MISCAPDSNPGAVAQHIGNSDEAMATSRIEPSVPRETTKVSREGLVSALLAATEKAARRDPISRRRRGLPRDQWFESGFLQHRVRCELHPGSAPAIQVFRNVR